jgi:uncharacterized protein
MERARWSGKSGCDGSRKPHRGGRLILVAVYLGTAALLLSGAASAQVQLAPPAAPAKNARSHHAPTKAQAREKDTASGGSAQAPARPPAPVESGLEPDLAFGAFQRGNYLTAFALAAQRASSDDPQSMTLLGELYANGLGIPEDDNKAADWYRLAAARGDPNAMFALAMFAMQGRAGARDRVESAKWLAAAAKLGHPIAAYDLALLYMEGELFPQDFARAAQLLHVAAQAGNPQAQYALGTLYKQGRGVAKDMHEAVRLFGLAALADQSDAEVEYAIALFNGDGIDRNQQLAADLFRKAAIKGNPVAQDRIAIILANGLGVPADPVEAAKWHLISKAAGETDLVLDDFVNKLDAKTRAAAAEAAKPWISAVNRTIAAKTQEVSSSAAPAPDPIK